ncbi:MAG: hypothetical protein ETSY1_34980 [Candidatus Entotheonella factor]|uniref:HTH cro/C1-type domain-containing protein n=1 Tax=Entotheonella factor TaxID=1429438 RepID=W4L957_ENTF1|nr:helix-turn-helix transcriptional regulator [Candidatus Entotheonella palauensis]ETW94424.1 MAG: hypothetical protein ETSY1_34980 [Candidatus Entotheonella factor]
MLNTDQAKIATKSQSKEQSNLNIRSVYRSLTPEERQKHKRLAELADQDREWAKAEADEGHQEAMRSGVVPRMARFVLMQERKRQGLSDEELMARSGLDAMALASMSGRDARPTIETMEAYARALGKKLLIVLADEESKGLGPTA